MIFTPSISEVLEGHPGGTQLAGRRHVVKVTHEGGLGSHIFSGRHGAAAPILADQQARPADVRRRARLTHPRRSECKPSQTANIFSTSYGTILMWESCRTMPLVGGFCRESPVSTVLSFRRCSILTSLHPRRLSRSRCKEPPKYLHCTKSPFVTKRQFALVLMRHQSKQVHRHITKDILCGVEATVCDRLPCSPPTKANRVQSVVRVESLVSPALSFRLRFILTSITLIDSQDLAVKSHQNLFTVGCAHTTAQGPCAMWILISGCQAWTTPREVLEDPQFRLAIGNVTTPLGREAVLSCAVDSLGKYKLCSSRGRGETGYPRENLRPAASFCKISTCEERLDVTAPMFGAQFTSPHQRLSDTCKDKLIVPNNPGCCNDAGDEEVSYIRLRHVTPEEIVQ
ncbi:hypothetical protein PR048_015687 [Dryococelus australis]|uniref:Uncharacterized protein n=1 Tax=Dryococelus australis TaxID=614101 RepID=A0ABQ9HHM5_9NEOP|nr:hypothetical protein PR048_015687 [Dryococelus australis]